MRYRFRALALIALGIGALAAPRAGALTVIWELGGSVDEIGFALDEPGRAALLADWQIEVGSPWSGRVAFDASAPPAAGSDPSLVEFRDPRTRFTFAVGALTSATASWDTSGTVSLNRAMPIADSLIFSASMTGSSLAPLQSFLAYLELVAPYGQVFGVIDLPGQPPEIEDLIPRAANPGSALTGTHFNYLGFALLPGSEAPIPLALDGRVTRLARVPELPAAVLLLPGLLILARRAF
jgi:hypothetical protein